MAWSCRFPEQPVILRYLEHVAERFDLKSQFDFNTKVIGAHWDEAGRCWHVKTAGGEEVLVRFLIAAVSCLSAAIGVFVIPKNPNWRSANYPGSRIEEHLPSGSISAL